MNAFLESERDRPAVDVTNVAGRIVINSQLPDTVQGLRRQIQTDGLVDVVRTGTGAVVDVVQAAIRSHQVHFQVTLIGVHDCNRH